MPQHVAQEDAQNVQAAKSIHLPLPSPAASRKCLPDSVWQRVTADEIVVEDVVAPLVWACFKSRLGAFFL